MTPPEAGSLRENADNQVIDGFGDEWSRFDQTGLSRAELQIAFDSYFGIFPWDAIPSDAEGFDMGCGSGRWAQLVAPRVGTLNCIDPSPAALNVARKNLAALGNCRFECAPVSSTRLADGSQDFGYCLGVLHHIPDTLAGLKVCTSKLKPGAPFLLYLYYAFDNRPLWFRSLWRVSDWVRQGVSRLPHPARYAVSQAIAALVYWPVSRAARVAEAFGADVASFPLSFYRRRSFYMLRTDALDRFGTRLEQRFSKAQITRMMEEAGLTDIEFSSAAPYWCAVARRAA
jgi:SAM-dependent methyltransferase